MIPTAKLELLHKQKAKFKSLKAEWFEAYNEEFLGKIKGFLQSNDTRLSTNQFNIVPSASTFSNISVNMMVYADFLKPTCKVELMRVKQKSSSEPFIF